MNSRYKSSFSLVVAVMTAASSLPVNAAPSSPTYAKFVQPYAAYYQNRAQALATEGLGDEEVRTLLYQTYPSAADHAQIDQWISSTQFPLKVKGFEDKGPGAYYVSLNNGRSFTLGSSPKKGWATVNGKPVHVAGASLKKTLKALRPALHSTFVVRNFFRELVLPDAANAATAIEYGMIAALIAVVIIGTVKIIGSNVGSKANAKTPEGSTAKPESAGRPAAVIGAGEIKIDPKAPITDLTAVIDRFVAKCQAETTAMKKPFERSETGRLFPFLIRGEQLKCGTFVEKIADELGMGKEEREKIEDWNVVCERGQALRKCIKDYEEKSLASFGSLEKATPAAH